MSTLLAPFVFVTVTILALTAFSLIVRDKSPVEQRLAEYDRPVHSPQTVALVGGTILKQREFSRIPALQEILKGWASSDKIARELAAAGLSLRVGEYLLIRWFCGLTSVLVVHLLGVPFLLAAPAGLFGFLLPRMYVKRRQGQRVSKFNDQLVDALTMMGNALKGGSSFLQAIDLVSRELPAPLSEEFAQVVAEVSVGSPIDEALNNLTRRISSYDLYLVVTAMLIQRQTGGSLAEILDRIAQTIRERIRLFRQVQVLTGEQRLSAIVVGLMPVGMLVFLLLFLPGYVQPLVDDTIGRLLLGAAGLLEVIGYMVMMRMANIEV